MSDQRTKAILLHILEDLADIQQFVDGVTLEEFHANKMILKAVCMSLLNIGEGISHIPKEFLHRHPEIPGIASLACAIEPPTDIIRWPITSYGTSSRKTFKC